MNLHFHPHPKPTSRVRQKMQKRADEAAAMRGCYKAVDARDGQRCRVCRKRANPNATTLLDRLHRHHIVYRSRGGQHETDSVVSICAACHAEIHVEGTLRLSGNADERNELGKLAGVKVERLTETGWKVERFV